MSIPELERKSVAFADPVITAESTPVAKEGIVEALVAVTGVRDDTDDIIVPGAFAKTLVDRPKPKVCLGHDWNRPIGKTLSIKEYLPGDPRLPKTTHDGKPWPAEAGAVWARWAVNLDSEDGKSAFSAAKFYGPEESTFSIGYKATKTKMGRDGVRRIHELELYEYGPVLTPANRLATLQSIKAAADLASPAETASLDLMETKAKFVRNPDFWGLPYGTPIKPGMKPRGKRARALAAAGKPVSDNVGVVEVEPNQAVVKPTAKGKQKRKDFAFFDQVRDAFIADPNDPVSPEELIVEDGDSHTDSQKINRGEEYNPLDLLVANAVRPQDLDEYLRGEADSGGFDARNVGDTEQYRDRLDDWIDEVVGEYRDRYNAELTRQNDDGKDDTAESAEEDATTETPVAAADAEGESRAPADLDHENIERATDRLISLPADERSAAAQALSDAELVEMANLNSAALDLLRRRQRDDEREQMRGRAELDTLLKAEIAARHAESAPPAAEPERPVADARGLDKLSDAELQQRYDDAYAQWTRIRQATGVTGRRTAVERDADDAMKRVRAEQRIRARAAEPVIDRPAHPLPPKEYAARRDRVLHNNYRANSIARRVEQAQETNAAIDQSEEVAATAPETIPPESVPAGGIPVGSGRLVLANPDKASWKLSTADGKSVANAALFTDPAAPGRSVKLNRQQASSLADAIAGIRNETGDRIPTTAPDSAAWARGFYDSEGRDGRAALDYAIATWAAANGLTVQEHVQRSADREPPGAGRPATPGVADAEGFYPREELRRAQPGDEIRHDGTVQTVREVRESGRRGDPDRITLVLADGTEMPAIGAIGDIRFKDDPAADPDYLRAPGMGWTPSRLGMLLGEYSPDTRKDIERAVADPVEPGTRITYTPESKFGRSDDRPRVGTVTGRYDSAAGNWFQVVAYDDGTDDALNVRALADKGQVVLDPTPEQEADARRQWGLSDTPEEAPQSVAEATAPEADQPDGGEATPEADTPPAPDDAAPAETAEPGASPYREPDERGMYAVDGMRGAFNLGSLSNDAPIRPLVDVPDGELGKEVWQYETPGLRVRVTRLSPQMADARKTTKPRPWMWAIHRTDDDGNQVGPGIVSKGKFSTFNRALRSVNAELDQRDARSWIGLGDEPTPPSRPYEVIGKRGKTGRVRFDGVEFGVELRKDDTLTERVVVTDPNGQETNLPGSSKTELRMEQNRTREAAVREALRRAAEKYRSDDQPEPVAAETPEAPIAASEPEPALEVVETPPASLVPIDPADLDEVAAARDEVLGLSETPDGVLEVTPEVAQRQDKVEALLAEADAGTLDLAARDTEALLTDRTDLQAELRLQNEVAARDAAAKPRAVRAPSASADQDAPPKTRPGLAGAAQDHAEALESGDAAAIERTRARLESAVRRSRADSDAARALAGAVRSGAADPSALTGLVGDLRAENRERRNQAARKRRTVKRLERERIQSLIGSIDAELRTRGVGEGLTNRVDSANLDQVTENAAPATDQKISDAYAALTARPGGWVSLTRLRDALPEVSREDLDEALLRMDLRENVYIIPEANLRVLSDADRAAAISIGGEDKHLLSIETPPAPAVETAPADADLAVGTPVHVLLADANEETEASITESLGNGQYRITGDYTVDRQQLRPFTEDELAAARLRDERRVDRRAEQARRREEAAQQATDPASLATLSEEMLVRMASVHKNDPETQERILQELDTRVVSDTADRVFREWVSKQPLHAPLHEGGFASQFGLSDAEAAEVLIELARARPDVAIVDGQVHYIGDDPDVTGPQIAAERAEAARLAREERQRLARTSW